MAIATAIPFPRRAVRPAVRPAVSPAVSPSADHPRRAVPITAQIGARAYSPYGRRRLARPMAVPYADTDRGSAGLRSTGSRLRLPFFRARHG